MAASSTPLRWLSRKQLPDVGAAHACAEGEDGVNPQLPSLLLVQRASELKVDELTRVILTVDRNHEKNGIVENPADWTR